MSTLPRRPWANIPRVYKTVWQKTTSIISTILFTFCLIYIIGGGLLTVKEKQEIDKTPRNAIAILLDTSLSMTSTDVSPNRYEHALNIIGGLLADFNATYFTIPYGGVPILRTPISTDTIGIRQVLNGYPLGSYHVSPSYLGSAPGNAIGFARDLLSKIPADRKTILLIGDGNTNTGFSIDTFIPYLQKDKIDLLVCAIGEVGYQIGTDYMGVPIMSERDVARLDYITNQTKGKRRVCNNREEAVERISMQLRDTTIFKSKQKFYLATKLWNNNILHAIAITALAYFILMAGLSFARYLYHKKS